MKKILIPTDFSNNAWDALVYAIRLYDDIACRFYILNTYEVNPSKVSQSMVQFKQTKIYDILKEESEKELRKIEHHLTSNLLNDKHEYEILSRAGSLTSIVNDIATNMNIDMIVMGTRGASGLKSVFMGSNTVKVIKALDYCPIISVPEKYVYEEPVSVIFATDYKKQLTSLELKPIKELQLIHNFELQFVHQVSSDDEFTELQRQHQHMLKVYFENEAVAFKEINSVKSVSKAITRFAENEEVQLIVLTNYEHSFIEKLTHEPVIKKVSFHSPIPLLIIPA